MPAFPIKVRTLESYLAGIGASGALIAGAFVASVLLVGIVTFDAWPTGSSLFSRGGGGASVDTNLTTTPPAQEKVPNLIKLLGGPGPGAAASQGGGTSGGSSNGPSTGSGRSPQREPQGTSPGGGGQQPPEPNRPAQEPVGSASTVQTSSPNLVQQTVSGLGNNLQSGTDSLSNDLLGGQDTLLGGVVGGLGGTVNNTLQGLAGTGS